MARKPVKIAPSVRDAPKIEVPGGNLIPNLYHANVAATDKIYGAIFSRKICMVTKVYASLYKHFQGHYIFSFVGNEDQHLLEYQ